MTTDRDALLRAIRANPDDDTARLVYADYLDEHGEAKRAAYIRAEIAYYRAKESDTAANAVARAIAGQWDRTDWAAVDADLGAAIAAQLVAGKRERTPQLARRNEDVPRVAGVALGPDLRGFLGHAWVSDTDAFLKNADALFAAAPVSWIRFNLLNIPQAQAFVRSGHLARIRHLWLSRPSAEALHVLGTAKDAAGVRWLSLDFDLPGPDSVPALAAGRHWSGLEAPRVTDNVGDWPPEPGQLAAMLGRPQFGKLRTIEMYQMELGDDAARVMAKKLPELRLANLGRNSITGEGAAALAASKTLRHLRYLNLGGNEIEDGTAVGALINAKNLPALTVLQLGQNGVSGPDPKALTKPGRGPGLRVLDLSASHLTSEGVGALVRCPALRGLWHFDLGHTRVGDEHFVQFAQHAAFERLTHLNLHSNNAGARGAKAFAAWPGAASLQWLDLGSNPIGESGAKALAASPHFGALKYLNFVGRGKAILKKRFKKAFGP